VRRCVAGEKFLFDRASENLVRAHFHRHGDKHVKSGAESGGGFG
jgi:hypothetical protein